MTSKRFLSTADGIFLENGWFFLGDKYAEDFSQACGTYEPDEDHASRWIESAYHLDGQCKRRGIPCIFMVGPAKWSIYPELLREIAPEGRSRPSVHDSIMNIAKDLELLDLRQVLMNGKKTAHTYSPRDSHWNGYGAYLAWQQMVLRLSLHCPANALFDPGKILDIHESDDWNEATNLTGIPGENTFYYPEFENSFPDFEIRSPGGYWRTQPGSALIHVSEIPVDTRCHGSTSRLRALILRDSVGDLLSPYLVSSFSETYQRTHHVNVEGRPPNISALLRDYAPDVVLFMITERYLIYPLLDLEMARACTLFDLRQDRVAHWPAISTAPALVIDGWDNPKQPVLIRMPPDRATKTVLKISMCTNGTGALLVSYTAEGKVRQKYFIYRTGPNDFYLEVNGNVSGDHIWILDEYNASPTFITAIALSY
ncbi:alginate O-acetyltransferase AlgX-related protein [Agrobacterium rubi]|nr:hypothetical protein [Agrobacterium rubi]